ncbi:MAG: DNA/RNA nuclease SfsA [Halodesulfurarchaeum sp.]
MNPRLHTVFDLEPGHILDRPNRFVLTVDLDDGGPTEVYLPNTGGHNLIERGRRILVSPVSDPDRRTSYDAVFVEVDGVWAVADANFATVAFESAVAGNLVDRFADFSIRRTEPPLPDGGRADFELETRNAQPTLVEVKSCSLVEDGVAKFPDSPTKRGRRHLASLAAIDDRPTAVVFVIQRPDGDRFTVNRSVDPAFADALEAAREAGVGIHAIQLDIEPPDVFLQTSDVPVEL